MKDKNMSSIVRTSKLKNFIDLIKTANFNQGENTQIFADKFPDLDKSVADRFYRIFGTWKDYDSYRQLLNSFETSEDILHFIEKCIMES